MIQQKSFRHVLCLFSIFAVINCTIIAGLEAQTAKPMEISFTTVEEVLGMAFRPSGSAEDVAQLNLTGQGQVIINDKVVYDGTLHAQVGDYQARMNTTNGNLCHGQLLFMLQQSMDKRRKKFGPVLTIHGDGVYTPNSSKTTAAIDPAWCTIELRSNKKKKR